ncbi:hypothetical protein [Micrococcus sp.]|uniref:hypothetical protein n=1 Tax=Micrococcus sp. TaxID=1271 RepID=UPI002A91A3FD|nr:hypothetical protein [Micrococcus sp.]MDY6054373.1 hypothetical protein [Micrococcus sp.]
MTKLNPDHASYACGIPIEYCDVVTRGKSTTLWEVVETEYPDKLRLSKLGSYGETNQWVRVAGVHFVHRRRFTGGNTCQLLLDLQERIRVEAEDVHDGVRYVRRFDQDHEASAERLRRLALRLRRAVRAHRAVLESLYGITD